MSLNLAISLDKEVFTKYLDTFTSVLPAVLRSDEQKAIVFMVSEEGLKLGVTANAGNALVVKADALIDFRDMEVTGETVFSLKIGDISKVLGVYNSLTKTQVAGITFEVTGDADDYKAVMYVTEEPMNPDEPNADMYRVTSKYDIGRGLTNANIITTLRSVDFEIDGEKVNDIYTDVLIGSLSSIYAQDKGKSTAKINGIKLKSESSPIVYAKNARGTTLFMRRLAGDTCIFGTDDIILDDATATFWRKVVKVKNDDLYVKSTDNFSNAGMLTHKVVRFADGTLGGFFTGTVPKEGVLKAVPWDAPADCEISVDRAFLIDVLKRCSIADDNILFEVNLTEEGASFVAKADKLYIDIPIMNYEGVGEYKWSAQSNEFLAAIVYQQAAYELPVRLRFSKSSRPDAFSIRYSSKDMGIAGDNEPNMWMTYQGTILYTKATTNWD